MEELIALYGVNVVSSILFNTVAYYRMHRYSKKNSTRVLKYKTKLNGEAKKEMRSYFLDNAVDAVKNSFIPVQNILYTLGTIDCFDELLDCSIEEYEEIARETDDLEKQLEEYFEHKEEKTKKLDLTNKK